MKIAIVSDSHDNRGLFRQASLIAKDRQAAAMLHCGDIVAPSTLLEAKDIDIPIHAIHGNNTGDLVTMNRIASRKDSQISFYGQDAEIKLYDRRIFVVHYPHYARAMAVTGDYDLVCYGHDHRYHSEWVDNMSNEQTLLVNPGSVGGLDGPACFLMLDLDTMESEQVLLN